MTCQRHFKLTFNVIINSRNYIISFNYVSCLISDYSLISSSRYSSKLSKSFPCSFAASGKQRVLIHEFLNFVIAYNSRSISSFLKSLFAKKCAATRRIYPTRRFAQNSGLRRTSERQTILIRIAARCIAIKH